MPSATAYARLFSLLLASFAACGDDGAPTVYVDTGDEDHEGDGDGDGDPDSDDGGGYEIVDPLRKRNARFCEPIMGACAEAEYQPFRDCANEVCRRRFERCGQICSDYLHCLDACDCTDRRCVFHCERSESCLTCLIDNECGKRINTMCEVPECTFSPSDTLCADLEACCVDLSGELKTSCEQTAESNDLEACNSIYWHYCER